MNRWYWFEEKFHLDCYPEGQNYWTPEQIIKEIAGKKVSEGFVNIIKDLLNLDCFIQGDYVDFPKEKNEEDYIDLTTIFYELWKKELGVKDEK